MNGVEGFCRRWEFRGSKVEGDTSSDDEGSDPRGDLITNLGLVEKDEADDDPRSHSHANEEKATTIHSVIQYSRKDVKADGTKIKSSKKKQVVRKKPEGRAVKGTYTKRRHSFNDKAMLKDLKIFGDSLVQELAVAKQDMFAKMRDEMSKLVASASVVHNPRHSQRKVCSCNGAGKRKVASDMAKVSKALDLTSANEVSKGDRVRLPTTVSALSGYIATPELQNQRNYENLINSRICCMDNRSCPESGFCKLMAARTLFGQLGGFSFNSHKIRGLHGESQPYLPFPLHQGMESGSSRSSLSLMSGTGVSIAKFPVVSERPRDHKDIHLFLTDTR